MNIVHRSHRWLKSHEPFRRPYLKCHSAMRRLMNAPDPFDDLAVVVRQLQPIVLDIGAYKGETVRRFLDMRCPEIHAFEPTPEIAHGLRQRFAGESRVKVHELALSDRDGEAVFHDNVNPQTNSLLKGDRSIAGDYFTEQMKNRQAIVVRTARLDTWCSEQATEAPLLIKADVQGAEGLLLDGGQQTFKNRVVGFYSEAQIDRMYENQTDFFELHRRLTDAFGFRLSRIYPCMQDADGYAVQLDALWLKPETR